MALTVTNLNTATRTTTSATLTVTGITADVGDWLHISVAADNSAAGGGPSLLPTLTDSAGNSYTNRVLATYDPVDVNGGVTLGMWASEVATAISSGTLTISFDPTTPVTAAVAQRVQPQADYFVALRSVGTPVLGNSGLQTLVANSLGTIASSDTVFAAVAVEGNATVIGDSDTFGGPWSAIYQATANSGAASTSQTIATQYKTPTTTELQTWQVTVGTFRDVAICGVVLYEDSNGVVAVGVQAQGEVGTLAVTTSANVPTLGVEAQAHSGVVTVGIGIGVTLTGVQAQAQRGDLAITLGAGALPAGVQAQGLTGGLSVTTEAVVPATGSQAQTQTGAVLIRTGVAVLLTGAQGQAQRGSLTVTFGAGVPITGVQAQAYVGTLSAGASNARVSVSGVYAVGLIGTTLVWGLVNDTQPADWHNINDTQDPGWVPIVNAQPPEWSPVD